MRRTADLPADGGTDRPLRDAPVADGGADPARALAGRLLRSASTERMTPAARQRVWARVEQGPAPAVALRLQVARAATVALMVFGSLAVAMATVGRFLAPRSERPRVTADHPPQASAARETPRPPATGPAPNAVEAVDDDLGLVYAARVARQPAESLRLVDDYLERYPRGQLRGEAMMVGVAAALSRGREESARALAARYLAESPDGPHRETARRVLARH